MFYKSTSSGSGTESNRCDIGIQCNILPAAVPISTSIDTEDESENNTEDEMKSDDYTIEYQEEDIHVKLVKYMYVLVSL